MNSALIIMLVQGSLGAFDTLYYHEFVNRLPANASVVKGELRLHAFRDFVYGLLFLTLPLLTWNGYLALLLVGLIGLEVCITIWDFNIEVRERAPLGGVADQERALHLVMAVVYGYFLAYLFPILMEWYGVATGFGLQKEVQPWVIALSVVYGIGVITSGIRDLAASYGVPGAQVDLFARWR